MQMLVEFSYGCDIPKQQFPRCFRIFESPRFQKFATSRKDKRTQGTQKKQRSFGAKLCPRPNSPPDPDPTWAHNTPSARGDRRGPRWPQRSKSANGFRWVAEQLVVVTVVINITVFSYCSLSGSTMPPLTHRFWSESLPKFLLNGSIVLCSIIFISKLNIYIYLYKWRVKPFVQF